MKLGLRTLLSFACICALVDLSAQVVVHESVQDSIVVSRVSCFIDHEGDLTMDQVLSKSFDHTLEEANNYLNKQNPKRQFWFKLSVRAVDSITAPLAVSFPRYSEVTVFIKRGEEIVREKKVGSEDIGNYYFEDSNQKVTPVLSSNSFCDILVAVKNRSKVSSARSFYALFGTQEYFDRIKMEYRPSKGGEGYVFLLFCGIMVFQGLYVLLQWYLVRKREYFYYVLYILSIFGYYYLRFSAFYSENRTWALTDVTDLHNFNHIFLIVPSIFYVLFASAFVDLRTRDRKLYKHLNILIGILTLCLFAQVLLLAIPNDFDKSIPFMLALLIQVPFNLYAIVRIARQRRKTAWFLVVGSSVAFLAHLLANTLPLAIPNMYVYISSLEITMVGIIIEVVIFNGGLLVKAKESDFERIQAQNLYIRELKNRQSLQGEFEEVRDKISSDLHDDVGSSLSSIGIYSYAAKENLNAGNTDQAAELLENIKRSAEVTLNAMSDLVWATNPRNDSNDKLIERIRSFGYEILSARDCMFKAEVDVGFNTLELNQADRKNLLLFLKEAINNAAKYSEASIVFLRVEVKEKSYTIRLEDDGVGFDLGLKTNGNGMKTMRRRGQELGGTFSLLSSDKGTTLTLVVD